MRMAYFARPTTDFGQWREERDIKSIRRAGFSVIDITNNETQDLYKDIGMCVFRPLVESADALFFRSFDDGSIGAGVAKEIYWATCAHIPIFELPLFVFDRAMSVADTREKIRASQ